MVLCLTPTILHACVFHRSAGPALAAAFFSVDFKIGIFPINDATAPAWLMVFLWSIYTVLLVAFFTEPVRHHHRHRADSHDKQTDREGSPRPDLTRDLVKSDSEIDILLLSTPVKKINS